MARLLVLAFLIGSACGAAPRNKPSWPDAPVALRDELDRTAAIDQLWVTPAGPARERLRTEIAEATARRLTDAVVEDRPFAAAQLLDQLTGLWMADPAAITSLARHAPLIRDLRKMFAKSGALEPAAQTLILLAELEPAHRSAMLAELDEILQFADDLAVAENGEHAIRSQPIALLQNTVLQLPLPWLVDRYVALVVARQIAVATVLEHYQKAPPPCTPGDPGCPSASGVTLELVRAHHDILASAHRIANVLARAGRAREIHRHLVGLRGIGTERELAIRAEVVAEHPTADAYGELASALRSDEHAPDPGAALALCLAGLAIDPRNTGLMNAAGGDASALDRVDQAIALYEGSIAPAGAELDTQVVLRLGKLYGMRIARLASGGRPAAASSAWAAASAFTARAAKQHPSEAWQQAAAIAESALGKGLASQGLVDAGRRALTGSLERAPSSEAYESLTTIEVQTARYRDAQRWAAAGIALLGDATAGDRYRRAKLERLAADALRQGGRTREAGARYLDALRSWASLGETKELPRAIAAERLLESGRAMWWIGDQARGIDLITTAVDFEASAGTATSGAVAFLLEVDRYREALDVFYRGLGDPDGNELFKVYTSLWILGDAKRQGLPPDPLATEYLKARRGDLWYELLARAAVGQLPYDQLRAAATTGPRKAELAFYGAALGLDPTASTPEGRRKLLESVIRAGTVLDAEFDLARKYLATP